MAEEGENRRKKAGKRGANVPLSELGFKAKVYYGIETEYTRRRVKYKAARYGAENSKECFMGRLTFIVDPNQLTQQQLQSLGSFKGISKHEWERVKQVIYHSRDELKCAICLENSFKAPQMTHCGHVFCWNCIYMHHFKSLKANCCPVCNEFFSIDSIVSCRPIYAREFEEIEQNKIKLALKYKPEGGKKIYDCRELVEDHLFARLIKATTEKVVEIYEDEKAQLTHFYSVCDDQQVKKWLQKILVQAQSKIQRSKVHNSKKQYRLHKTQRKINGYILSQLEQSSNLINFYQQHSGKFIFLHPLSDKYLRNSAKQLPEFLQQQILKWQQVEYNTQMIKKYKQLHHIVINQQIDLVLLDLRNLISEEDNRQYHLELEQYNVRKKEQNEREERECERLQVKYQKQKEYMQQLKKMEESQFFDIKLPTTLNPGQIDSNEYFPSLIQTKSMPEPQTAHIVPSPKQKSKKKQPKKLHDGDFPELFKFQKQPSAVSELQATPLLQIVKSQQPRPSQPFPSKKQQFPKLQYLQPKKQQQSSNPKLSKKGSRKKRQKFVNVTDQFFQSRQDEDY